MTRSALLLAAALVAALALVPAASAYIPREPVLSCIAITARVGHPGGIFCAESGGWYYPRSIPAKP